MVGALGERTVNSSTPGVRWFAGYQSIVERGQERPDKVDGVLDKAQGCIEDASGVVAWTEGLML
jgi:hypothetical protein